MPFTFLGINDYIVNWQANLRQVFARILIQSFLRPYDRSNQDLEAKGLGRDLLDHTNVLQTDFFDMLKKLKEQATELHNQRILRIKHPEFNKNSMQVVQKQTGKANQLHNRLLDRLESDFKDYNNLELRYVFGIGCIFLSIFKQKYATRQSMQQKAN